MGYRSDVRVMTDLEGFEKMQEIAWDFAKKYNVDKENILFPMPGNNPSEFYDYYDAQEEYFCFGFDWYKWYEEYVEVSTFMKILFLADNAGVPWQFMRVGEEHDDVENVYSDRFFMSSIRGMGVGIIY